MALAARYVPDPIAGPAELARLQADPAWGLVRSLHAWSAYATLAVAALHTGRVLYDRAWQGLARSRYVAGVGLAGLLVLAHLTGFALRWDGPGRRIARALLHALQPLGGGARLLGLSDPGRFDEDLLERLYLIHSILLGLALAVLVAVHLAGLRPEARPWTGRRLRAGLAAGLILLLGTAGLAWIAPPPVASTDGDAPWPFQAWKTMADAAGSVWAPLLAGLLTLALLAAQPWIDTWPAWRRAAQLALGLVVLLSFAWVG